MVHDGSAVLSLATVLAVATLVCGGAQWSGAAGAAADAGPETGDPRRDMVTTLAAPGPHPSLGERARLFDRFVGTWDADYTGYAEDGSVNRFHGQVIFGWIIDGRALQDVWISYPKDGTAAERRIGTSVRFFDAKAGTWRVAWIAPADGGIVTLAGGAEGERIVLLGRDSDGSSLRWSFNEIRPDTFVWRGEVSRDGGKTWRLAEEHRMRRRGAASAEAR